MKSGRVSCSTTWESTPNSKMTVEPAGGGDRKGDGTTGGGAIGHNDDDAGKAKADESGYELRGASESQGARQ